MSGWIESYSNTSMSEKCYKKDPDIQQCCCICMSHRKDYSHPHTDGKAVTNVRGYICQTDSIGDSGPHSGWPKHSVGCELFGIRRW